MQDLYSLMHKDDTAAVFSLNHDTKAILSLDMKEMLLMPPRAIHGLDGFRSWWEERSIPKNKMSLAEK